MPELGILNDVALVVLGATVALLLLRPLRVPSILAFLLAGLLLGPVLGWIGHSEALDVFSELGIALLLFVVGLEFSIERIRDVGRPAALAGLGQVILTFGLGYALALGLGFDTTQAAFLGLAVTFSSTVVVVKLLDRAGEMGTLHGRVALGVLLVQDVLVAVVLTLLAGLAGGGGEGGGASIPMRLATAFVGLVAMTAIAAAAVRWILPALFAWLANSGEALFIAALTWAFAFILASEAIHVAIELGAFVAGVALAQLPYNHELRNRVHPLVDFFLAVFFVTLGAGMDPAAATEHPFAILVLSFFVLVVKPFVVAWLLGLLRYGGRSAFLAGVTLGQVSEFAFILLAAAGALVDDELMSLVGIVGVITIGVSSLLIPAAHRVHGRLARGPFERFLTRKGRGELDPATLSGHVIVIGMNTLGRMLVQRFADAGQTVLAVDNHPDKLHGLPALTIFGSVENPALLEGAGFLHAKLVVSALQIEDINNLVTYRCARAGVPCSIHAFEPSLADELLEIGADHVMISKIDGIAQMQSELRRLGVMT